MGLFHSLTKKHQRKIAAWKSANPVYGFDPCTVRKDCDGRYIRWDEFGGLSDFGWDIDHTLPPSLGGSDVIKNLRARHWQGSRQQMPTINTADRTEKAHHLQ